jgi:hypothetical protein
LFSLFKCYLIFVRFAISIQDKNRTLKFKKKSEKSRVEVDRNSENIQRNQSLRNFGRRFPPTSSWLQEVAMNQNQAFTNINKTLN